MKKDFNASGLSAYQHLPEHAGGGACPYCETVATHIHRASSLIEDANLFRMKYNEALASAAAWQAKCEAMAKQLHEVMARCDGLQLALSAQAEERADLQRELRKRHNGDPSIPMTPYDYGYAQGRADAQASHPDDAESQMCEHCGMDLSEYQAVAGRMSVEHTPWECRDALAGKLREVERELRSLKSCMDQDESDERLTRHPNSDAMMREALGQDMFDRLWGPGLEALGKVVDVALNREATALAAQKAAEERAERAVEHVGVLSIRLTKADEALFEMTRNHKKCWCPGCKYWSDLELDGTPALATQAPAAAPSAPAGEQQKTSEDGSNREVPHGEKQTASQTTRARDDVATPSSPGGGSEEPGISSAGEHGAGGERRCPSMARLLDVRTRCAREANHEGVCLYPEPAPLAARKETP